MTRTTLNVYLRISQGPARPGWVRLASQAAADPDDGLTRVEGCDGYEVDGDRDADMVEAVAELDAPVRRMTRPGRA